MQSASLGSDAGNNSFSISLEVTRPDLQLGAELFSDLLSTPAGEAPSAKGSATRIAGRRTPHDVARKPPRRALQFSSVFVTKRNAGNSDAATRKEPFAFRDHHGCPQCAIRVFGDVGERDRGVVRAAAGNMKPGELAERAGAAGA
jgi:hypothetical protein